MPFAGSGVAAPIMAAKQGMKDLAFAQVTDQAKPVVQFVKGALTGQGSGLQAPSTQANAGPLQAAIVQAKQEAGQAMTIGKSESWAPGATTGFVGGGSGGGDTVAQTLTGGGLSGAASVAAQAASGMMGGSAAQGLASAQSMLGGVSGMSGIAPVAAAALGLGGSGQASAGSSSIGSSLTKLGAGSVMDSVLPEVTPGQKATAPQFTALPQIPSIPRLQDVAAQLGAMATSAAKSVVGKVTGMIPGLAGGADSDSGMTARPASQFSGTGPAASYDQDS